VPDFFTELQKQHLFGSSQIKHLLTDEAALQSKPFAYDLNVLSIETEGEINCPTGTQKITFTSGSTGSPKGVCLSKENQLNVAQSLATTINTATALNNSSNNDKAKHLCLLPFSTLLENIAGIYAVLLSGGTVVIASDEQRGFKGSKLVNPHVLLTAISSTQPNTLILVPELLKLLVTASKQGWQAPSSLTFIAVGGAKVDGQLISQAHALGLPVYQGYGLSEAGSVVALNTHIIEGNNAAGELLAHSKVSIENGEVIIHSNLFLGYLGEPESWYPTRFATGDLGELNGNSLQLSGRRKNLIINAFGRNISPEWPESLLDATGAFMQVVVLGDGYPALTAVAYPFAPLSDEQLQGCLALVNQQLPDYAQIAHIFVLSSPISAINGCTTANGKFIRPAIEHAFKQHLDTYFNQAAHFAHPQLDATAKLA
jgi:long-subunit acyl-CoA synthetase (AMP-forming)